MSQGLLPFVAAWMDELGLTPVQFRVLAHLWRRAERRRFTCWAAGESIARTCRINRDTVWPALAELERRGLMKRHRHRRMASTFELLVPIQVSGGEGLTGECLKAESRALEGGNEGGKKTERRGHKGYPLKGIPSKDGLSFGHGAQDPLLAELVRACGADPSELTEKGSSAARFALKGILVASPGVDATEIWRRADCYRRSRRDWPLTPNALDKHWAEFPRAVETNKPPKVPDAIPEPNRWREVSAQDERLATFSRRDWERGEPFYQRQIADLCSKAAAA